LLWVVIAGLKPSDVTLMASLSKIVPVIPLLAKVRALRRFCVRDPSLSVTASRLKGL